MMGQGEEPAKNETECQQQTWKQTQEVWPSASSAPPPTRPHCPKRALKAPVKFSHDPISKNRFLRRQKEGLVLTEIIR